jgi:hypothetical protein
MTAVHTSLKEWFKAHPSEEKYFAYSSFMMQMNFFNSVIPQLFTKSYEEAKAFIAKSKVVGEHTSKSIHLPVVLFHLNDNTTMVVRNNFTNWKVSINSEEEIICDFMELFDPQEKEKSVYCEGFHWQDVYGPYSENKKQFTLNLDSTYDFYTFLYILQNHFKQKAHLKSMFV